MFWRRLIPYLAVPVLGALIGSLRTRWCATHHVAEARAFGGPVIYAFWHENILQFAWTHRRRRIRVMISRHGDGQLIARCVELLGFAPARGSSSRGGASALRAMARSVAPDGQDRAADLALTPDGPRGPRRTVQGGVIDLAARTGLPILPAAVGYRRCWRIGSWDRMAIPRPFTRTVVLFGEPLLVTPAHGDEEEALDDARQALEERMQSLAERAEAELESLHTGGTRTLRRFDPLRRLGRGDSTPAT